VIWGERPWYAPLHAAAAPAARVRSSLNSAQIGPYDHVVASLEASDPRSADVAELVASWVKQTMPELEVEHVGSTAVPQLAGKGIVDLMVLYPEGMLAQAREALDALGFQRQTFGVPFPEERPMRVGTVLLEGQVYRVHAHVLVATSWEVDCLRAFRDRLRADPGLAAAYVERKRELIAAGIVESPDYAEHKGGFILAAIDDWSGRG
jgi:GrpB-like predicted nucleotidyltransferase (UPF0157 family)